MLSLWRGLVSKAAGLGLPHVFVIIAIVAFGMGWAARDTVADIAQTRRIKAEAKYLAAERHKANMESIALETELARETDKRMELEARLRDELQNAAYRCIVPSGGVRLLHDAAKGSAAR